MKMKTVVIAAALAASTLPAFAADKLKLSEVLAASDVTISGRVDAGYDYANTQDGSGPLGAAFNTDSNSFVLHQAALNIVRAPAEGVGGAVTVLLGEDAKVLNAAAADSFDIGNQFNLLQGYVSYAHGPITVIGGRFLTLAGAEVIDSSANFNATRGILFNVQPLSHTGVRGSYKVNDTLSFTGGLVNSIGIGNQDRFTGNGKTKTVELNGVLTTGPLTNALTVYVGDEGANKDSGRTILVDTVSTYALSPATTFVLNADYLAVEQTKNDTADLFGFALYGNQKLGKACRVAARAEYVHNNQGNFGRNLSAYTLTYGHTVAEGLEVMAEARLDDSAGDKFYASADRNTQIIGTVKAVYKF